MRRQPRFSAIRLRASTPVVIGAILALSACTSSQNVLEPSALVGTDTSNPLPQAQFPLPVAPGSQPAAASQEQLAAIRTDARIQFSPVVGAPAQAATPLAARLSQRAGARGIGLAGAGDPSATHVMKGYFSAISDKGETTVIYVWDVVDQDGNRIHRIQGQAKSPIGGNGWAGVGAPTMEAIADQTVDQLAAWLVSRPS